MLLSMTYLSAGTTQYNSGIAVEYATKYWNTPYLKPSGGANLFTNYEESGGNCANFVSQSILAGLVKSTRMDKVYEARLKYTDKVGGWYAGITQWNDGYAWRTAKGFYNYMTNTKSKGMNTTRVTGRSGIFLKRSKIEKGDVASWGNNSFFGSFKATHTTIVTDKKKKCSSWFCSVLGRTHSIYLTYQTTNRLNRSIDHSSINYRPLRFYRLTTFVD